MTFGSVPLKRIGDFENGDMPEENPVLERQSAWVAERSVTSPTDLASMLAEGCSNSMDLYPTADSYAFNISPKKPIDQNLYVYHVGIRLAERGKPWGFYLTTPVCSIQLLDSLYDDRSKGVRRVCMQPDFSLGLNTDFGNFMNHLEDVENRLKSIVYSSGENVDNWRSPIKQEDGHAVGLYAKCRNAFAIRTIEENSASLRLTIKLSCVYFAKENCGLSFEVTHAFSS